MQSDPARLPEPDGTAAAGKPPRRFRDVFAAVVYASLIAFALTVTIFHTQHTIAIHRLTRGVGDTVFYAASGQPWFRMNEQRRDVPLESIAQELQQAVIAIEDHRFSQHFGIDPLGLARAMFRNATEGAWVEGGSTITQQLARTLFLSNRRTWGRKIQEAALALMLETQLSKRQILEFYLNRVYLGGDVYGVEPMAQRLFGKPAKSVSLPEAALMAGIIQAPSALSPWSHRDAAVRRSHVVLARMREIGFIERAAEQRARTASIRVRPYAAVASNAGYAKEYLRQEFRNRFGGDHPPDWRVQTTFIPAVQEAAERAVEHGLRRLRIAGLQAALVAMDPTTGGVIAMVGGRDFRTAPYNRARRSRRQPGSAFKPFVFASALERGFTPVSTLSGLSRMQPMGPEEWAPRNASGDMPDEMTLREAIVESNNRAAVALQQRVGSGHVIHLASSSGLSELPDVPSLALGTGLVTPLELTGAYAIFPNGGLAVEPRGITRVVDAVGQIVFDNASEFERVISPETAFQMVSLLMDVVDRGTGSGARSALRVPVGGKTGTTNDFKDAWFVGFSPAVVASVWVGFDQPQPIGRNGYGGRLAMPIWADFMRRAVPLLPGREFPTAPGLKTEILCRVSYLKPVDGCPTYEEYFKEQDDTPSRLCPLHEGTIRQRARRVVEGFLGKIGRAIGGLFKRN